MTKKDISPAKMYLIEKFERKYGTTVLRLVQLLVLVSVVSTIAGLYFRYEAIRSGNYSSGKKVEINISNTPGSIDTTNFEEFNTRSEEMQQKFEEDSEQMRVEFERNRARFEINTTMYDQ